MDQVKVFVMKFLDKAKLIWVKLLDIVPFLGQNLKVVKVHCNRIVNNYSIPGDTRDVMWLIKTIYPSIVKVLFIDKYNHDDYVLGMDAPKQVYRPVLEIMEGFLNGSKSAQFLTNSERMEKMGTVDLGSLWDF